MARASRSCSGGDFGCDPSKSEISLVRTRRSRRTCSRADHSSRNHAKGVKGRRCPEGVIGDRAISTTIMEDAKADNGIELQHEPRHQRVRRRSEETIARRKRKKERKMAERKGREKMGSGGSCDNTPESASCSWSSKLLACARDRCLHTGKVSVLRPPIPANTGQDCCGKEGRCRGGVVRTTVVTSTSISPSSSLRPPTRPGVATHVCECDGAFAKTTMIRVRPLVILDINGILCHRVRDNEPSRARRSWKTRTGSVAPIPPPHPPVFRKACGYVASTPVVPRTDLQRLLTFLDANFTLAVWSSAKKKTVNRLVKLLFPPQIAGRLLFVWGQNRCFQKGANLKMSDKSNEGRSPQAVAIDQNNYVRELLSRTKKEVFGAPNNLDRYNASAEGCFDSAMAVNECPLAHDESNVDDDEDVIDDEDGIDDKLERLGDNEDKFVFMKSLDKVWSEYPLWDESNTVLVDDTPQKCPERFRNNAIHPPPILGHQSVPSYPPLSTGASSSLCTQLFLSDEANQVVQGAFFARLAEHWRRPQKKCCSCCGGCASGDFVPQAANLAAAEEEVEVAASDGNKFSSGCGFSGGRGRGNNGTGFRTTVDPPPDSLHVFLKKMAAGHMGYIGDVGDGLSLKLETRSNTERGR